jgi:translation initiation factor 3 subunit F
VGKHTPCFVAVFRMMVITIHAVLKFRYATHPTLNAYSALIQNYFSGETQPFPAVHITVDTELTAEGQGLGVKGWVSSPIGLTPKAENCVFLPVPVAVKFAASERAGRKSSSSHHPSTVPGQTTHVQLI